MSSGDPVVNFVSVSGGVVAAGYENLPQGARIVFVNTINRHQSGGIGATGSGSTTLKVPPGTKAGDYMLQANDKSGAYLAQSVTFHLSGATA